MIPVEFISFAGKVVAFGQAGARSAISRAYYGVFHECRDVLQQLGVRIPGSGVAHVILENYLKTTKHSVANLIGNYLSDLHSLRVKADYDLTDLRSQSKAVAQQNVVLAIETLRLLAEYRTACLANDAIRQDLLQAVAKVDAVRQVRK